MVPVTAPDATEDVLREAVSNADRRLDYYLESPLGGRCLTCGHVKHNDLGYCQTGQCACNDGTTVATLATIIRRDLRAAALECVR